MNRKKFLKNITLATGALVTSRFFPVHQFLSDQKKLKGRVTAKGKGLAGVVVSDGYSVLATGKKGEFFLDLHPDAQSIFVSTPSGYAFKTDNGIARHYRHSNQVNRKKELEFELEPLEKDDSEHSFIIWADPQVKNEKDVDKMMKHSVKDVKNLVERSGADALLHGITVGDIVWDNHELFADYEKAVDKMGIPFFQCLGNHDMDYNLGGDETSDASFRKHFGPTYYSFNRGQLHYVVMDNVRYLGKDRNYDGFLQQHQLDWLQKDLALVPKDNLIILCVHIPVHSGTKNKEDLYALLQDRKVHIMSGHTHYHVNAIQDNIYEHNHGTVCGAWWTGNICGDGTPNGYGVYRAKGNELSWHYQSTGQDADYQLSITANDFNAQQKQIQVNIWNYDPEWKTEYWVDGSSKGTLEQFEGFDPVAYASLLGPELPKARGFAEPKKTNHLFKAILPAGAREVNVVATDRFGNKYSGTHKF